MDSPALTASADTKNFALQVALQTMKERCIQLQRRLSSIEEENQKLREGGGGTTKIDNTLPTALSSGSGAAENFQLRLQVAELQRQKTRLSEHINMVSDENRKLWSRLSQMSKEQLSNNEGNHNKENDVGTASPQNPSNLTGSGANQNLIRSKTFTQHSPNPHLRQRLVSGVDASAVGDDRDELSLEEIALDDMGAGEAFASADEAELGYPYIQVVGDGSPTNDPDLNFDAKRCIEGLQELRREAMKQQIELTTTLAVLQSKLGHQPCPDCAQKAQKPEMADKSLETDESLTELKNYNDTTVVPTVTAPINIPATTGSHYENNNCYKPDSESTTPRFNVIQEKINADAIDKTCPMCGKIYTSVVTFKAFQEHVEMHFIDDSIELESSMERNFEFISHAVGDF